MPVCAGEFENLLVAVCSSSMLGYVALYTTTSRHFLSLSLSLSPHLFNLPISLLSSSSFSPFAPAIRRAMGARITSPNSRRLLFSFFFFNFFFFFFHLLFPSLFALFASSRRAAVATGARRGSNDYGDHLPLIFIRAPGPELNARVRR